MTRHAASQTHNDVNDQRAERTAAAAECKQGGRGVGVEFRDH